MEEFFTDKTLFSKQIDINAESHSLPAFKFLNYYSGSLKRILNIYKEKQKRDYQKQ